LPKLPFAEKRKAITVMVPESLFIEVKLLLLDPKTSRVRYGAMSNLLTQMLAGWVEDKRKNKPAVDPDLTIDRFAGYENE